MLPHRDCALIPQPCWLRFLYLNIGTFWLIYEPGCMACRTSIYNVQVPGYICMYQLVSGVILKDANEQFLPSIFPRIAAAIYVLLLIGILAPGSVAGAALLLPML